MADMEENDSAISVPISTTHRTSQPTRSILKRSRQSAGKLLRTVSRPVAFRLPKRERPAAQREPGEPDVVAIRRRDSQGSGGGGGGFLRAFLFGAPRMRRERTDDYPEDEDGADDPLSRLPDPLDDGRPIMPSPVVMPHPGGGISFVPPTQLPVNPPPLPLDPTPPQEGEYRKDHLRHSRSGGLEDPHLPHTPYGARAHGYPSEEVGMGLEGTWVMPQPEPSAAGSGSVSGSGSAGDGLSPRSRRSSRREDLRSPRSHESHRSYATRREYDRELAGMPPTPPQPHRRVVAPDIPHSPPMSPLSPRSARSHRSHASRLPPPAPPITVASPVREIPPEVPPREPRAMDYAYQPAPAPDLLNTSAADQIPQVHIQPPSDGPSAQPSRAPSRPVSRFSRLSRRTHRSSASAPPTASGPGSPQSLPLRWDRIPHAARPLSYFFPRSRRASAAVAGLDPAEAAAAQAALAAQLDPDGARYQSYFLSRLPPHASPLERLTHTIENISHYPWHQKRFKTVQFVPGEKGGLGARYEIPELVAQGEGWASWYTRPGETGGVGEKFGYTSGGGGGVGGRESVVGQSFYAPRREVERPMRTVETYAGWEQPDPRGYGAGQQGRGVTSPALPPLPMDATPGPSAYRSQPPLRRSTTSRSRPHSTITLPPPPPPKSPRVYRPRGLHGSLSPPPLQATVVFREDGTPELIIPEGAELPTSPILITDPMGRTGWFMPQAGMARSVEG